MFPQFALEFTGFGSQIISWLLDVAEDLGRLAIYATIGAAGWRLWQRTLGRRHELERRLNDLAPLMQVDRFIEQLGVPAVRARGKGEEEDLTWVHPDAFIRVLAVRGTVDVMAVTTRNRWFRPTFFRGVVISADGTSLEVTLGKTTYGDLSASPTSIYADVGARRWGYSEVHYHGNPGGYMHQILAISDAGWIPQQNDGLLRALVGERSLRLDERVDGSTTLEQLPQTFASQRHDAVFNTIAFTKPNWHGDAEGLGFTPGADKDVVRITDLIRGRSRTPTGIAWIQERLPGR